MIFEKNATPENVQLYPAKKLFVAIDKLKKCIFNATDDTTLRNILEDKKSRTLSPLDLYLSAEFKGENLTAYDELVYDICLSEQVIGNEQTTPAIIHRAMGGSKTNFTAKEKERIMRSIRKLATTWIKFDCTDIVEHYYRVDRGTYKYEGVLLPTEYITKTINGQLDTASIHFIRKTPLLDVAKVKGQFIICDIALLDVPNIKNTETVLTIKSYLFRRIIQIVGSYCKHKKHFRGKIKGGKNIYRTAKELEKTILLDTLFAHCGLSNADRGKKRDARNVITKILDHFKAGKLISEWHFEKDGGKFRAIKIEIGKIFTE